MLGPYSPSGPPAGSLAVWPCPTSWTRLPPRRPYDNGVLTLRIPLAAHAKPRKIAISGVVPKQLTS
ncbi:hypothetical protein [Streptomyces sp. MAI_2237]